MADCITVFEYGYLSAHRSAADHRCVYISPASFEYLEKLCLKQKAEDQETHAAFLRLRTHGGMRAIQVMNYVGVIHTPAGQQIEVLPKTCRSGGLEAQHSARQALLNMLRHLGSFRYIETANASVTVQTMPLFEVFIRQFLLSVNGLVKRGLHSEYIRREDNQQFMKGKLLTAKQLKHNLIHKHRFYVEYDEYLLDRPVNRLIHSALMVVAKYTRSNNNQKLCRELQFAFQTVPLSVDIQRDFTAMKVTRGMDHYHRPLEWTKLILEGLTPLSMQGKAEALSLLFPMEAVFEAYVASILRKQLASPFRLVEQAKFMSLVKFNGARWFKLKPDILIEHQGRPTLVMDTKWKVLDSNKANGSDKFGLSQADFYQMFAYGHKYLNGEGKLVLIYPKTDRFTDPISFSFDFNKTLKLWVVPFDIDAGTDDKNRLKLNQQLADYLTVERG